MFSPSMVKRPEIPADADNAAATMKKPKRGCELLRRRGVKGEFAHRDASSTKEREPIFLWSWGMESNWHVLGKFLVV